MPHLSSCQRSSMTAVQRLPSVAGGLRTYGIWNVAVIRRLRGGRDHHLLSVGQLTFLVDGFAAGLLLSCCWARVKISWPFERLLHPDPTGRCRPISDLHRTLGLQAPAAPAARARSVATCGFASSPRIVEDALARRHHLPGHVDAGIHAGPGSAGAQTSAAPDSVPRRAGTLIYNFGQVARAGGAARGAASPQAGTPGSKARRVRGEMRTSPPGAGPQCHRQRWLMASVSACRAAPAAGLPCVVPAVAGAAARPSPPAPRPAERPTWHSGRARRGTESGAAEVWAPALPGAA